MPGGGLGSWHAADVVWTGETATGIVARHMEHVPVDLMAMAEELGLHVVLTSTLPEGVSGRIARTSNARNGFRIEVNAREAETRQRFTLAHEISHYVLHRDLIGDDVTDDAMYRSSLSSTYETQANFFAASILMPGWRLRSEWRADPSVPRLAALFAVSPEALRIRLRQVGLEA